VLLIDTHVLVWMMFGDRKLGARAGDEIRQACSEERTVVSAITPWEIALLVSKKRIELYRDVQDWMNTALSLPGIRLVPLDPEIAVESTRLPWEMHSDPADRILVATSRKIGATLVTADQTLLAMAGSGKFRALDATV
jgi:PIN domain nuclease of toxin-antitoxin system